MPTIVCRNVPSVLELFYALRLCVIGAQARVTWLSGSAMLCNWCHLSHFLHANNAVQRRSMA